MDHSAAQSASLHHNRPLLARVRVLPTNLYMYIWRTSRRRQLRLCMMTGILAPLGIVPLELQRRIVDTAINTARIDSLLILGGIYFAVVLLYGGIKYLLNMEVGVVLEEVTLDLRQRMIDELHGAHPITHGTATSVVTAEAEEIGNFASDSFALPLLQGGTILWTVGYLIWVQPEVEPAVDGNGDEHRTGLGSLILHPGRSDAACHEICPADHDGMAIHPRYDTLSRDFLDIYWHRQGHASRVGEATIACAIGCFEPWSAAAAR
jgi:hypothetical protein